MNYRDIDFFPGVNLIICNACRMKCSFCCASHIDKREKIDKEKLFKLIDVLKENGTRRICFTGGEPLLCPYFEELVKYSYDKGIINTVMSSDGELVNKLNVDGKYFDTFWLSIHGLGEEHDQITNMTGSFNKLEKALDEKHIIYPLGVWSVITTKEKDKLDDLIKWCIDHHAKKLYLSNLNETGDGEKYSNANGRIPDKEFAKIVDKYQKKYEKEIPIFGQKFDRDCQCALVYPNGDIYLTPFKGEENSQKLFGNLLEEKPKEVFQRIKKDNKVWEDYISRYEHSSLFKKE